MLTEKLTDLEVQFGIVTERREAAYPRGTPEVILSRDRFAADTSVLEATGSDASGFKTLPQTGRSIAVSNGLLTVRQGVRPCPARGMLENPKAPPPVTSRK